MKKRILSFSLLVLSFTIILSSCFLLPNNQNKDNYIYNADTDVSLILADETLPNDVSTSIFNALKGVLNTPPAFYGASAEASDHEIIIGKCDRELSKQAYEALAKLAKDSDDAVGYVIYSDGNSIAIAYDEWEFHLTAKLAIEQLIAEYIKPELTLAAGVVASNSVVPIEYYEELDKKTQNEAWDALKEAAGESDGQEIVDAFKALYSVYSRDILTWMANLYSKRVCVCDNYDENGNQICLYPKDENGNYICTGGAFYYSVSARDNAGYLPDIESTAQILACISSTGMTAVSGGSSYEKAIPEWMKNDLIAWVKSLQDPSDGCFYHPQWGKNIYTTRRDRDLNWANGILTKLGAQPFYTPPTGDLTGTEDMVSYEVPLTNSLGTSNVLAVSKVINVASSVLDSSPWLESVETFKEYLAGFDLATNAYFIGNAMTNQTSKIKVRDKEIGRGGTPLMDTLIDWFNAGIREDTGHWYHKNDYYAVNAIMKIMGVYNSAHRAVPTPDKMVEACLEELMSDRQPQQAVEIYNVWQGISKIITNLRQYAKDEVDSATGLTGTERADALVRRLRELAPDAIRSTAEKVAPFRKADGGLSYNINTSAPQSQLVDTAVRDSKEGDVNGTALLFHGLIGGIYVCIGLGDYIVPIFGESDRLYFMSIINDLGPIVKDGVVIRESDPVTFDEETVGEAPTEVKPTLQAPETGSHITVIADPRENQSGNVLYMYSPVGAKPDSVQINNTVNDTRAKCLIFDGDLCILSELSNSTVGKDIEFEMSNSSNKTAYSMIFKIVKGNVHIWEASSLKESSAIMHELAVVPVDSWFNLRIEYYKGNHDTVRIKIFVNKKLVAVTDNYGGNTADTGTPVGDFNKVIFRAISNRAVAMLFDNVHAYNTLDTYTAVTDEDLVINVDTPSEDEVKYDFEDGIPSDITISNPVMTDIVESSGNKGLEINALSSDSPLTITVPAVARAVKNNLSRFSMDILVNSASDGDVLVINLLEKYSTKNSLLTFKLKAVTDGDETYLVPTEIMDNSVKKSIDSVKIPVGTDKSVNIRFDFYAKEKKTLIYLDDVFLVASGVYNSGAERFTYGLCTISTVAGAECDIVIDNIVAERNSGDFDAETKPRPGNVTHDFEGTLASGVTTNGTVDTKDGDKVLTLYGTEALSVALDKRSNYTATAIFKANVLVPTYAQKGSATRISLTDVKSGTVVALDLIADGHRVTVHEVMGGQTNSAIAEFAIGEEISLTIEYYSENQTTLVFVNEKCIVKSNIVYNLGGNATYFDTVTVFGLSEDSAIIIDDVIAETYNKFYTDVTVEGTLDSIPLEIIDFESATTATIPSAITTTLASSNASISVTNVLNALTNTDTKALVLTSNAGGNDGVTLGVTKPADAYNVVIYETDMCLTPQNAYSTICQISLGSSGNAYMLTMVNRSGFIYLKDMSNAADASKKEGPEVSTGIKTRQWFNLKIEFYISPDDAHQVVIKTYINGSLKYVSDNYYNSHKQPTAITEITRVSTTTLKDAAYTVTLDNMSLKYETVDYVDDSFTHEIKK